MPDRRESELIAHDRRRKIIRNADPTTGLAVENLNFASDP